MEDGPVRAKTPLQRLLKEHYELGEAILDIEDEALRRDLEKDDDDEND
jgi:hypothetical protein